MQEVPSTEFQELVLGHVLVVHAEDVCDLLLPGAHGDSRGSY